MKSNAFLRYPRARAGPSHATAFTGAGVPVLCVVVVALAGCSSLLNRFPSAATPETPPKPATAGRREPAEQPVPAPPARPRLAAEEAAEVARLLDRADRAIADDHLTYPAEGSALALFDRVRILDPGNDEARRGLERIVDRYLELAITASEQRRFPHAEAMLDRARLVDPDHPGIAPTESQIRMLADADRRVIPLDGQRLRDQDPSLAETLRQAGLASRGAGCRAEITARSDSEGRWIYQQMSEAPGQERIRAQLDIGSEPRIEVLCFPEVP